MKKIRLVLSVFVFFVALFPINAQIENEIKSFVDSTELLVNNGRKMLLQHVQTKDFQKVAEIYDFLNEKTHANNCSPFTYTEDLYIAILINDWDFFLTRAELFFEITKGTLCYPIRDNTLVKMLHLEVKNDVPQLFGDALNVELTSEEKELLELYFYLVENDVDETYSKKLKDFKKKYPQSIYKDFVNNYLPRPAIKGGMAFSGGVTQIFPTGSLSTYFDSSIGGNMSFEFYYNKFFFGFQMNAGGFKFKIPLDSSMSGYYDKDFQRNDRLTYFDGGLILGYSVLDRKKIQLSPFALIGGTSIESNLYKDAADNDLEFKVVNSFTVGAGLRAEVNLFSFEMGNAFYGMTMPSNVNLRFDVGYNIPVKYKFTPAEGNVYYARLALVWANGNF